MRRDYSRLYLTDLTNGTLRTLYRQNGYWRAEFREPLATIGTAPGACEGVTATLRVDEGAAVHLGAGRLGQRVGHVARRTSTRSSA